MSTETRRTADDLHVEIAGLHKQLLDRRALPDSPEYWRESAEIKERQRDLWRLIADGCGSDVPEWARRAASHSADLCSDQAREYRKFAADLASR